MRISKRSYATVKLPEICDNIVRFAPVIYGPEQMKGMHGLNENIECNCLQGCVDFYKNMIRSNDKKFKTV